jgi:hypothetical protein
LFQSLGHPRVRTKCPACSDQLVVDRLERPSRSVNSALSVSESCHYPSDCAKLSMGLGG